MENLRDKKYEFIYFFREIDGIMKLYLVIKLKKMNFSYKVLFLYWFIILY